MKLNHSPNVRLPDIGLANGEGNKQIFKQLMTLIYESFTNIYEDLANVSVTRGSSLPTASSALIGKFYLKSNAGADDTLHICIYDANASVYKWQETALV